jgi:signal transduction histidine kinase/response regulator RpfG family c-di-GMP phosphodiesterase
MNGSEGKASILLVDDRPEKVLAIEAVLEDLDIDIVRAYSGREALRCVLNQDFAVILLDVNMPGMDGFETAALIRQRKSSEHIPVIFITSFGDDHHIARGYEIGAVDYIQAPVIPSVLRTKVAVFVDLYRKTAQVRRQAESLRRRAAQLQKLTAASLAINSALSIERLLQNVTDTAREVIGSHQAITLFVVSKATDQRPAKTLAVSSFSDKYAHWRKEQLRLDPIANSMVAQSHTVSRMTESELRDHPDWEIVRKLKIPPVTGGILAAPLTGRSGENFGVIYLSDRLEGEFTNDDEAILVQLAQMASIAIENTIYAEERETNRIKDEFLSTLSHELRTPLNAILGWTQLLRMEDLNEEASHGLEVIERNVRAQTKLIEDLLDVSRITTGKLRLNVHPIRLTPVIEAAVDTVRPAADAKNISLELHLPPPGQDHLNGDPDRLQQVVWNLLANAIKFTPSKGRITITVDAQLATGNSLPATAFRICVSDTGLGISPTFLPFVFDRFRQADSTSTRSHGGLGIGLTIVRHIVELHGGSVAVDSKGEGHGSSFTLHLPVAAVAVLPPSPGHTPVAVARSSPHADTFADLAGLHILVVDDEPDALELIAQVLKRAKARVVTANSVAEALELLDRTLPDLIVSDIAMPTTDGFAFIRQLRQLDPGKGGQIPAIALTAYARDEDRQRALSAGFQQHLTKPVEPTELVAAVAQLLPRSIPAAELASR